MEELIHYQNYEEYKRTVDRVLNKTVEDFVTIGYLLKKGRDTDILKESGYANINEFAEAEYHLDASQVSRFIRINDKFAENGYSERLKEQYRGYGYAKLAIMLTLPDELNEELSPSFSKTEIQAVKEEVEEETKITDIEVILEGDREEQKELNNLQKSLHQLFEDTPELFECLYTQLKERPGVQTVKEILAPAGEKVYSVRIQGAGRIMLFLNESEENIRLVKVRTNEKETHTWEEVWQYAGSLFSDKGARERWSELYGREFPEEEKVAPVQEMKKQKEAKKRKETKVQKAKLPEKKKPKAETGKKPEEKEPGQVEGQTELTKDFPEYCPDAMNRPEEEKVAPVQDEEPQIPPAGDTRQEETHREEPQMAGESQEIKEPQTAAASPYKTRAEYIKELGTEEFADYMASAMRANREITFATLIRRDYWKNWLGRLVDEEGRTIEEG